MGNTSSFEKIMKNPYIWFMSIIMGYVSILSIYASNELYPSGWKDTFKGFGATFVNMFIPTYFALFILHSLDCSDNGNTKLSMTKMLQDLNILYQALIYSAIVTVVGLYFKPHKTPIVSSIIIGAIFAVLFPFIFYGFSEWFSCKNYIKDENGGVEIPLEQ